MLPSRDIQYIQQPVTNYSDNTSFEIRRERNKFDVNVVNSKF